MKNRTHVGILRRLQRYSLAEMLLPTARYEWTVALC